MLGQKVDWLSTDAYYDGGSEVIDLTLTLESTIDNRRRNKIVEGVQSASLLDGVVGEIDKDIPNNVSALCWKENT